MNIAVLTHTGSDMPLWEAQELGIKVIPDIVIFGEESYRNMVDITADQFYDKLINTQQKATSSHPSVGEIMDFLREAAKGADEVLFLAITSRMSGSYLAAVAAKDELLKEGVTVPIYIYDTLQCSHGMALMVREAARLAKEGLTASEIVDKLDAYRSKIGVYFILDTLKYARMGGRVGTIRALAADTMGIKPLLVFDDGVVTDIGIARSFNDGIAKVINKYESEADFTQPVTVFHQAAPDKAEMLVSALKEKHPDLSIRTEYVGPVIGLYAGPGGAGLAFVQK